MRLEFINFLVCPACASELQLRLDEQQGDEVWSGSLNCGSCQQQYAIVDGIPHLYVDDESWAPLRREAEGWVEIHKEKGIYEPPTEAVDLKIPYLDGPPWASVGRAFDLALAKLDLQGGERILDLGAGRGWAAKYFAQKGCEAVALDIVADLNIGLGRAYALMKDASVRFDLLIGDASRLPLPAESFDLVFCSGTLHHAENLDLFLANIARVLKRGGRLCAINEPALPIWQNESRRLQETAAEELEHGINEHLPRLQDYLNACHAAGLQIQTALPSNLWDGGGTDWEALATNMGARWGGFSVNRPISSLRSAGFFAGRRLAAALNGTLTGPRPRPKQEPAAAAQVDILNWCGGELFLLAERSP